MNSYEQIYTKIQARVITSRKVVMNQKVLIKFNYNLFYIQSDSKDQVNQQGDEEL